MLVASLRSFLRAAAASLVLVSAAAAQTVVFADDFENGLGNWSASNWHAESSASTCGALAAPYPNGNEAAYFGSATACNYEAVTFGTLQLSSSPVLPPSGQRAVLRCWMFIQTESGCASWDTAALWINGLVAWSNCPQPPQNAWFQVECDVTRYLGQALAVSFAFSAGDGFDNGGFGWMVDDLRIEVEDYTTSCAGDGSGLACPCGNSGAPGHGCGNSLFPAGGLLAVTGIADRSADTVVLHGSNLPNASCTYFQGTTLAPVNAFDGILCVGGTLIRLGSKVNVANTSVYPAAGDASVAVRGQVPAAGGTYEYTTRYRNAASFCTPETANFTNAVRITWSP
ncbi:MAG: hypothetical protein IPJ77_01910 [Planctomycetes bacterium]|nr:hypothetical protein [Planctomycetota bacterium]